MGDWLFGLPVVRMGVLILGAVYLFTAALYVVVTRLAVGERARAFNAISSGILSPLAIVFATGVGVAVVLIASHSRPFTGQISVSPSVLQQVMPEGGS